ncbi:MAG: hypothetical protein RSB41_03020 [Bacilli bacterium]
MNDKFKELIINTPDYVFIPVEEESLCLLKSRNVYSLSLIGKLNNNNVFSSVSGKAIGMGKNITTSGEMNTLVIENNFKDMKQFLYPAVRSFSTYKKEEIKELLEKFSLLKTNVSNNVLCIYIEYIKDTLITDSYIFNKYVKEILETIDLLSEFYSSKSIKIIVNNKDDLSSYLIRNYIGTYPNMEVIYSSSSLKEDVKKIIIKNKNIIEYSLSSLLSCYIALKYKKYNNVNYISLKYKDHLYVCETINGISVKDILSSSSINEENITLRGTKTVDTTASDSIITEDINSILVK